MFPLQVAQVTLTMGQGGIENLIISLTKAVDRDKFRFSLYCLDAGGELLTIAEQSGVRVTVFDRRSGLDWRLVGRLAKAFRADGVQVVHTHNEAAHFYGCLAARLARVPVVINTEHSRNYIEGHWQRRLEKKVLSLLTDRVVTVSEHLRQFSIEQDRLTSEKLAVIANGVDITRFSTVTSAEIAEFRNQLRIPSETKLISIVARLHPLKNLQLLLSAAKILVGTLAAFRVLLVGDGEERKILQQQAVNLGIEDKVVFLGSRSNIPVILKASDVLVLCSITEGLPLVLLEGMAAQVPIVVTESANQSRLIKHGVTGFECANTAEELAATMTTVIGGNQDNSRVTEVAFRLVNERYGIAQTMAHYEQIYVQCLAAHGRSEAVSL